MQLKYLPIGSVCSIDNSNNKYMVIGYKKNDYDFVSVLYPDGFINDENFIYFNEGQITEIYSLGYKDEYGIMYSKKINIEEKPVVEPQAGDIEEPVVEDKSVFEEGSVVDEEGNAIDLTNDIVEEQEVSETTTEEPVVEVSNTNEPKIIKTDSPYIFNEEGIVIAIKPEEKKEEVVAETSNESTSPYVFDENGTIIAVNEPATEVQQEVQAEQSVENASPYVFDENGTIIAVNEPTTNVQPEVQAEQPEESTSPYVFDENGTIIAINEPTTVAPVQEETKVVPTEEKVENPKYKFDENGFLVSIE